MKYHAMLSLLWDVNLPARTVITMARGIGGTLQPADIASYLRVDNMRLEFIMNLAERDMYEVYCDQMRDSGAWEP